jgi:hypothetical protein
MRHDHQDDRIRQKSLAVEQARYEAARARRQYDSVDAANRLVAAELEGRWNAALKVQTELEEELESLRTRRPDDISKEDERALVTLGGDLRRLWDHPRSPAQFKKRVLRTALKEILVTADGPEVQLTLHWQGGDHTRVGFEKVRVGQHRFITDKNIIELVQGLARLQPDGMIASILNRNGYRTPHGKRWTAGSVCSLRNRHGIKVFTPGEWEGRSELTVEEVAVVFSVADTTVLQWIRKGRLLASQLCPYAPWVLRQGDVDSFERDRMRSPSRSTDDSGQLDLQIQ